MTIEAKSVWAIAVVAVVAVVAVFGCAPRQQAAVVAPPSKAPKQAEHSFTERETMPPKKPIDTNYYVAEKTKLTVAVLKHLSIWAHPGAKIVVSKFERGSAFGEIPTFCRNQSRRIPVTLPDKVLSMKSVVPSPAWEGESETEADRKFSIHQYVSVVGKPSETVPGKRSPQLRLGCGKVEILAHQLVGETRWQKVRQQKGYFEIIGWTWEPITHNWGNNVCRARTKKGGGDTAAEDKVSEGYSALDPRRSADAARKLRQSSHLYLIDEEGCHKWRYRNRKLTRSYNEMYNDWGRVRKTITYGFKVGEDGVIWVSGPAGERTQKGKQINGWGIGCSSRIRLVEFDASHFAVVGGKWGFTHFHPDDVTALYRSKKACEATWAETPRLPLDADSYRFFSGGVRTFNGCL